MSTENTNARPTTLIVCVNRRFQSDKGSCAEKGSEVIAAHLERGIAERNINITLERIRCLGECSRGPAMRVAPGGKFFLNVKMKDIPGLLNELEQLCGFRKDKKKMDSSHYWPGS